MTVQHYKMLTGGEYFILFFSLIPHLKCLHKHYTFFKLTCFVYKRYIQGVSGGKENILWTYSEGTNN